MSELRTIPIVPNGLRYWVLPDKKEDTTINVGGVTLTGASDSKEPPIQGRVVAVGDAVVADPRPIAVGLTRFACKYKRDDLVIYGKYAGTPHTFEDVEYTILHEEEILGLVIETPFDPRDNTPLNDDPELR